MPPSNAYRSMYRQLEAAINRAIYVSRKHAGILSPTGSHFYASALFTLLITKTISLRKLLPVLKPKTMPDSHWDYGSVCTLTRSILETRLAFFYLGYESCSDEEWRCRWAIFCLHDEASRQKMLEGIVKSTLTPEEQSEYDQHMLEHRSMLQSNSYFTALSQGDQRSYLQGKKAYLQPLEDIALRCRIETDQFRFFYTFMSQHAHSFPVSYFRMEESNRGRGSHSDLEEQYHLMCIGLVVALIEGASTEMEIKFAASAA